MPPDRRGMELELETGGAPMPRSRPVKRLSDGELAEPRAQLIDLLGRGWIQHSTAGHAAAAVFAREPDGTWRICYDYRGLNAITRQAFRVLSVTTAYPSPSVSTAYLSPSVSTAYLSPSVTTAYLSPSVTTAYGLSESFRVDGLSDHFRSSHPFRALTNAQATPSPLGPGALSNAQRPVHSTQAAAPPPGTVPESC